MTLNGKINGRIVTAAVALVLAALSFAGGTWTGSRRVVALRAEFKLFRETCFEDFRRESERDRATMSVRLSAMDKKLDRIETALFVSRESYRWPSQDNVLSCWPRATIPAGGL